MVLTKNVVYNFAGFCARVDRLFALSEERNQRTILSRTGYSEGIEKFAVFQQFVVVWVNLFFNTLICFGTIRHWMKFWFEVGYNFVWFGWFIKYNFLFHFYN